MGIAERKRKERQSRIDLIKKSAGVLFKKKGFKATKVEEIAARAEISKPTIYEYFKSKSDLFYEMMQERLSNLNRELLEIYRTRQDPEKKLQLFMGRTYEFAIEEAEIYHLVTTMKAKDFRKFLSADKAEHLREIMASNLKQVDLTIRDGIEKGIFRKIDTTVGAVIFWNMFMGIMQNQENRLDVGKKDYRKSTLDTAVDWLIVGLKKT
jgi:AcrR family transcriptional regulator